MWAEDLESIENCLQELGQKSGRNLTVFCSLHRLCPLTNLTATRVDAVNREGFRIAHDISAYSFVAMAKACRSMLNPNSAPLTPSLPGRGASAIPNYNTMGLSV